MSKHLLVASAIDQVNVEHVEALMPELEKAGSQPEEMIAPA